MLPSQRAWTLWKVANHSDTVHPMQASVDTVTVAFWEPMVTDLTIEPPFCTPRAYAMVFNLWKQ